MKLGRRRHGKQTGETPPPVFGTWVLRQFAGDRVLGELPFAELEQIAANAGSIIFGAAFSDPAALDTPAAHSPEARAEALTVARHTANGFKAALEDRKHTVLAWPWEHLATHLAWQATHAGIVSDFALGTSLQTIALAYAAYHREQLATVLGLWEQVVAGLKRQDADGAESGAREEPASVTLESLPAMGARMLEAWRASLLSSGPSQPPGTS
jgi:hypothetical protein